MNRMLIMAMVLAAGILAATATSLLAADATGFAVVAPLIMSVAVFVAVQAGPGSAAEKSGAMKSAAILAGSVIVASLIVVFADPQRLALVMPVLGVAAAAPVLASARRREPGPG